MGRNLANDTVIWKYKGCKYCAQPFNKPQMKIVKFAPKEENTMKKEE